VGALPLRALATQPAAADAPATHAPPTATAVVPPRTDPSLARLRPGIGEWLSQGLAGAGLELVDEGRVAAALAARSARGQPSPRSSDVAALAGSCGAGRVLLSELWLDGDAVDLRLHLHGADGELLAGAQGRGPLGELPSLAQQALLQLVAGLGLDETSVADAAPPRLSDWAAFGRARAHLESGELAEAWRELAPLTGPAAERLRAAIDARADAPSTPAAARSRLANASGRADGDWLRVRDALRGPPEPTTLLAAADAALARVDLERALRLYERVLQLDPESAAAARGRAECLAELGRAEEAATAFERAATLAPEAPDLHRAVARLAALPPERRAEHLLRAGELHAARFEADAAREHLEEAGRLDSGLRGAAQRQRGELEERLGNPGEALVAYEQAAALGARDADVLLGIGRARAAASDRAGAAEAFREALQVSPEHPGALAALGEVLAEDGQDEAALPHLERAVELTPSDVGARRALARVQARRGSPQRALELLEPASLPQGVEGRARAELLSDAARIRRESGDLAGAERTLATAVALEPDDPPLRAELASLYEAAGQADRAQIERALAERLGSAEPAAPASPVAKAVAVTGKKPREDGAYATFEALAASFPTQSPGTGKPLGRVLLLGAGESLDAAGRVRSWLYPKRADLEAIELALLGALVERFPIEETPPLAEESRGPVSALLDFSSEREVIATANDLLASDAVFVARLGSERAPGDPVWAAGRPLLEVRMLGGATSESVFILANALALDGVPGLTRWNPWAAGPWLLVLLLVGYPVVRGWGSVVVRLDYDKKAAKGFFQIRLSRRPGRVQAGREKEGQSSLKRFQKKSRFWARFTRNMADGDTRFRLVPARTWYVHVHGLLTDARSKDVIGSYVEERAVRVERGQTAMLAFDLRPREAPIEVRLVQGDEQAPAEVQALAALGGKPESIRYLRGGAALLQVANGTHRVLLGTGDRVYEESVQVLDLSGASVQFRLDSDDGAVFTGCPEAVDPYVHGDLMAAAQALESSGQERLANGLRAEYHRGRGEAQEAARYFEAAGRAQEAAELSDGSDAAHSATLFAQAGDFGRAAERYRESGELAKAAEAYEAAFDYDAAIECYRSAGNAERALELLEKTGRYFEAGQAALGLEDAERAIRNLQMVDLRDPDHGEACRILAQMFADVGDLDLAAEKLSEAISAAGDIDGAPLEMLEQLGDLLQRAGRNERALETFETIRKRDYTWPGAAQRIEALRELRQSEQAASGFATHASASGAMTQTAGGGESRYEILAEIGRGGMGVVYQARDRRLGRSVALKRLPDNLRENPTAVALFLREARAAAALNHPNIVTLFDADQEDGHYYLTMEFLDGLPLDKIVATRGRLSARDCVRLGVQIATGLQYAHEQQIVHRDIKTSNLFFTRDRVVKIMDFGLAKMVAEVRRAATVIGGTPYYMAPEQATGENVDTRADLYAFGVTLFEMLTGTVPFREGDVTWHHRNTPPPDPRSLAPDLPDALAELVLQLMEKDPAARPESAAEVGARLAEIGRSLG